MYNMFTNIFNIAKANIKGGKKYPKINGAVTFREVKNGVLVTAKVNGLPQSSDSCTGRFFGFHIHEGSSCSGTISDEFANAKTHLNPTNCPHPFHMGDLPPLIENNGYAHMTVLINKFKIKDILGKVVIIHDSPDDFTTQPSGNSGSKIACGIIE
jgi:copper/zinc superoxide dismutase (SODC)